METHACRDFDAIAADQPFVHAMLSHRLEPEAKRLTVTEPTVAILRER